MPPVANGCKRVRAQLGESCVPVLSLRREKYRILTEFFSEAWGRLFRLCVPGMMGPSKHS